jgi:hypothetical protein
MISSVLLHQNLILPDWLPNLRFANNINLAMSLVLPVSEGLLYLYERARRLAKEKAIPIEEILVHQLETTLVELPTLPPDEQAELDALTHLSDDALWTIAREQMEADRQTWMQTLMDRNNLGTISSGEHVELEKLVE